MTPRRAVPAELWQRDLEAGCNCFTKELPAAVCALARPAWLHVCSSPGVGCGRCGRPALGHRQRATMGATVVVEPGGGRAAPGSQQSLTMLCPNQRRPVMLGSSAPTCHWPARHRRIACRQPTPAEGTPRPGAGAAKPSQPDTRARHHFPPSALPPESLCRSPLQAPEPHPPPSTGPLPLIGYVAVTFPQPTQPSCLEHDALMFHKLCRVGGGAGWTRYLVVRGEGSQTVRLNRVTLQASWGWGGITTAATSLFACVEGPTILFNRAKAGFGRSGGPGKKSQTGRCRVGRAAKLFEHHLMVCTSDGGGCMNAQWARVRPTG